MGPWRGSPTPGPDKSFLRALSPRERAQPPPGEAVQPWGDPGRTTQWDASAFHQHGGHSPQNCWSPSSSFWSGCLPPFPRGASAAGIPATPGQPPGTPGGVRSARRLPAEVSDPAGLSGAWARVRLVVSGPFPASCSGSVLESWPPSFCPSLLFRAFSPRSPCFRLGKVREMLPSVLTPEPFGLNSKCGRQRPWGAGWPSTSELSGPREQLGVLVRVCLHWVDIW